MKNKFNLDNLKSGEKKQIMSLLVVITLVGVVLLGTSYAWLNVTKESDKSIGITAGTLNLAFEGLSDDEITLSGLTPISDSDALKEEPYTFKVTNTGDITSNYIIYMEDLGIENEVKRLDNKYVKYNIIKNGTNQGTKSLDIVSKDKKENLITSSLAKGETDTYSLRIWLDEENFDRKATGKILKKSLKIEASQ